MDFTAIWRWGMILLVSPAIGSLPIAAWVTYAWTGRRLSQLGTGNVGVSAAFYHGGKTVGVIVVLLEALKGVGVVLLTRWAFGGVSPWELVALLTLVLGRYWGSQGAGTTNVVWGYLVHDWKVSLLTALIAGSGYMLLRQRQLSQYTVLGLLPLLMLLLYPQDHGRITAAIALSGAIAWGYSRIADDLALTASGASPDSQAVFGFLKGNRGVKSLDQGLDPQQVGAKAANLAQLKGLGYPVPPGWVVLPGDDPAIVAEVAQPSGAQPVIVRSSAIGEDSELASAAGQYVSIPNVFHGELLAEAIAQCLQSYYAPPAVQYRRDRGLPDRTMAVLVQRQVDGAFSGVAFSRDPIQRQGDAVVVEALPGGAARVVSGRETPDQYRVDITAADWTRIQAEIAPGQPSWRLPEAVTLALSGTGDVPPRLIQQVAWLTRCLEMAYHGLPQDVEWSYDGHQLWVLQARPVTTLLPIWTRKIAAEVIPGVIHPLTWSINRPLTCGVWGDLFTLGLGDRAQGLDFTETATLHGSRAYFNATLLGTLFIRMGLPAESLEFLTRGAAFSRPPLSSTLQNGRGLWRLLQRELQLERDFQRDQAQHFAPTLATLRSQSLETLSGLDLLTRIEEILAQLRRATYYNILGPLGAALRPQLLRVKEAQLDYSQSPEVEVLRSLRSLAAEYRPLIQQIAPTAGDRPTLFAALADHPAGAEVRDRLDRLVQHYGYLSDSATNLAVPRWHEQPDSVHELFTQWVLSPPSLDAAASTPSPRGRSGWAVQQVQRRLDLKGQISQTYNQLLDELRQSLLALGQFGTDVALLRSPEELFFLDIEAIRQWLGTAAPTGHLPPAQVEEYQRLIDQRRCAWEQDAQQTSVPDLVYGHEPPPFLTPDLPSTHQLFGLGASPGQAIGTIHVVTSLQAIGTLPADAILVVPYTDAGWASVLARAHGVIAEVGGRLSHGAIVAREYGIPAVMNVSQATQRLQSGQRVQLNGTTGQIDVLS